MRLLGLATVLVLLGAALAGCTSPRDIETEAKEREDWAAKHNDHPPVGVLSGPDRIAPGALVWYSAHGSHDPDFFGAKDDTERNEARGDGGVHVRNDATDVRWSWYAVFDDGPTGLGNGIRKYVWQIDDRPPLVAHELTHRHGSEDGPTRLPVGFTETGTHTLRLTVVDWSGEKDTVTMTIEVTPEGTDSTVRGWQTTETGWTHERIVPVSIEQYGDCPAVGRGHYDATVHHMDVPWELLFFSDAVQFDAKWDVVEAPDRPDAAPADPLLTGIADPVVPPAAGLNLNDIGITLGHCEKGTVWERFDDDQDWSDEAPVETGVVDAATFARHVEKVGPKTEPTAAFDFNVYLSDQGEQHWGKGGDVRHLTTFVPATDTGHGGQ